MTEPYITERYVAALQNRIDAMKESANQLWLDRDQLRAQVMALSAENAELRRDAERYRWLRMRDWFDGPLCVVRDPQIILKRGLALGADCPSRDRLDEAIDAALKGEK